MLSLPQEQLRGFPSEKLTWETGNPMEGRGVGRCSKLGAQFILKPTKNGCAKSELSLLEAQKVGSQMHTLAH